ncbi:hypothetical protein SK128_009684 [Halocaridina rubra]|uniref:Uncharacterized protein n=1 Tax=Halocaridina rubra TaxID=373956 RepID=A0AAN8XGJ7_HALRR
MKVIPEECMLDEWHSNVRSAFLWNEEEEAELHPSTVLDDGVTFHYCIAITGIGIEWIGLYA